MKVAFAGSIGKAGTTASIAMKPIAGATLETKMENSDTHNAVIPREHGGAYINQGWYRRRYV